ncbi:EamA family transporter [Microbacterium karelineae]|uniref:EamA family transporter n=1 Tax=Microbacterium karelineae TaxID=2654283 RepID=UPI0012EA52C9|nr:EamA family transporter [Microbacterium karelineae]
MASSARLAPVALIAGSCVSLQFGAALAVQLFPALGSWGMTALRVLIAAVAVLLIARPAAWAWDRRQWGLVAGYGLALGGMNGFFYASLAVLPLGPAVAIEFLGPLLLAAALSRRIADISWVVLALGAMGLFALDGMNGEHLDPTGVMLVLIAAAFWALYIRLGARVSRNVPGLGGLGMGLAIAAIALIPFGVPAIAIVALDPTLVPLVIGTVVLASVVPYSLELLALRRLSQRAFGILLSLEPVFAALFGWLLLAQDLSPLRIVAIVLVVAASIGTAIGARPTDEAHPGTGLTPVPIPARGSDR